MAGGMNIAALASRTGVAPDTLRKWEQRYGVLQPTRTAGGQRRYSERDVARVEWLRARLDEGYRIGEAAALLGHTTAPASRGLAETGQAVREALARGDAAEVGKLLDQAFALHPIGEALSELVEPLLKQIGDEWETGEASVAQEHLLSEAVRARLGHLVSDPGGGVRGQAVMTTVPGERHELGLMMIAIGLRNDGWQIVYLGPDTPLDEAVTIAEQIGARLLCLSVGTPERAADLEAARAALGREPTAKLVIGGRAATAELAGRLGAFYQNGTVEKSVVALRELGS